MASSRSQRVFTTAAVLAGLLLPPATVTAMDSLRWTTRPLIVFAPESAAANLSRQRQIVAANRAGFVERDMAVLVVTNEGVSADLGKKPVQHAAALRRRYGIAPEQFRVLLVGKDGGVKLSSSEPIAASRLFSVIDAMPMRRQEMHQR
jgi:hypothetical protein